MDYINQVKLTRRIIVSWGDDRNPDNFRDGMMLRFANLPNISGSTIIPAVNQD